MFRWYVVNTYSGHENKVKQNLEHRLVALNQNTKVRQVVVPTQRAAGTKWPDVATLVAKLKNEAKVI
mgnify:CR=1 FL=1